MIRLDAAQTAAVLPFGPLADALAEVLLQKRRGMVYAPARLHLPLAEGVLLIMPSTDGDIVAVKRITVHPGNTAKGLPAIQGEVTVAEAASGRPLLQLDGPTVTSRRTAALSLLAARLLAPNTAGPLLVVGAGVQATAHALAFFQGLGVREFLVVSRAISKAAALAGMLREKGAVAEAAPADRIADILGRVPLVVTATTSREPVLPPGVRGDAFVAAVGSFTPEAAELPGSLVRAARVYVDDLEAASAEAGDLMRAGVDMAAVTPLERIVDDVPDRAAMGMGPVIFKSVGHALFDLAAARLAMASL
ncbi:delta(1)-pyrroline-2-carboxylate reductase family protein [Desulfolutivibrio sulfoxidireducens]|uniref:delta(1)-pyrroline-2-carboxylate reductase family protein n=1 Tax=Desulfolutivibrio sulfoxidireducens TaxID=2773299 RepID=UPI00159E7DBA|nr:delta(1)-pyrroline-2-carboxylate reductase family protein [Desulfolutivibrio sulfoxidireducens]QLA16057.1 delta(1)-pyrroline-2-carboxylate reductase family protein [Desulfolutivibrio sulfoxidireducens]QLA20033.1 delta(1)-pyrroline-2-carboxylate reductase family protein [Desulfolutivibrio sulfoxidireducens]